MFAVRPLVLLFRLAAGCQSLELFYTDLPEGVSLLFSLTDGIFLLAAGS